MPGNIVLTFDDAVANHAAHVAPLLRRLGFGATFYIAEYHGENGDRFDRDKRQYMTWEQIAGLHAQGFEIGNHALTHAHLPSLGAPGIAAEIEALEARCAAHGIPRPRTFAYPGGSESVTAAEILQGKGYLGARSVRNAPWRAGDHSRWSIPSYVITGEKAALFDEALALARAGETVVYTFHGVPDDNHPWVTTPPEVFAQMMEVLRQSGLPVVSLEAAAALA